MYEWIGYFLSIDFINALHKRGFTGSWHFCNNVTFSVTRMWRCVGSRTAGNLYLPEGSKGKRRAGLSYISLSSCLIGWFGVSAVSRRGWEKVIKSADPFHLGPGINSAECMRFVCSLCSLASVNLVHTHLWPIRQGSFSEGLWQDLSLNQTCQPHIPRSMWLLKIDCHLASAQGSIWLQKVILGKRQTPDILWFTSCHK